jgi:hypothetical protein
MKQVDHLDSISAKMLLLESYETLYGIFNHDAVASSPDQPGVPSRPLALVAMHPQENIRGYSRLYQVTARYLTSGIGDRFHMSLEEYLRLPTDYAEYLHFLASQQIVKDGKTADTLLKQMNATGRT